MLMRRLACAALAAAMCCSAWAADISLGAMRVAAKDVPALAKFYQTAFGMHEVGRLKLGKGEDFILNFGADAAAAKASSAPQFIVMQREADTDADTVPHVIFYVADIKAVSAAVVAAGGKMGQPIAFNGMQIAFGNDPAGNRFELIQRAASQ